MADSRFQTPPVVIPLPSNKIKTDEQTFVILTPQIIPHPSEEQKGPLQQQQQQQQPKKKFIQQHFKQEQFKPQNINTELVYDSDNLSYSVPTTRSQLMEYALKDQLRRG